MNWGWGFKPPTPANSNPGRHLAHRPHTPISIALCALALAPTLPPSFRFLVPPMDVQKPEITYTSIHRRLCLEELVCCRCRITYCNVHGEIILI